MASIIAESEIVLLVAAIVGMLARRLRVPTPVGASLTAELMVGNAGFLWSIYSREAVESFWEYAAFVANALIFVLIGIRSGTQYFAGVGALVPVAAAITILARAVAICPCCTLFTHSTLRVELRHQHILFWGGLRGALALALALGLPPELP